MSNVGHLSDEQLRELVEWCTSAERRRLYFRVRDIVASRPCNQGNLSRWKNDAKVVSSANRYNSPASIRASRAYCETFFASNELPAQFANVQHEQERVAPEEPVTPVSPRAKETVDEEENVPKSQEVKAAVAKVADEEAKPNDEEESDDEHYGDQVSLCTWNLKNLGAATPAHKRGRIVLFLQQHDVVAVQEVLDGDLHASILRDEYAPLIEHMQLVTSERTGTTRRRESLAFFYNKRKLRLVSHAHNTDVGDAMPYKPYIAIFEPTAQQEQRARASRFTVVNVHIKYGDAKDLSARRRQVDALHHLVQRMTANKGAFGEVYVCGDFNLEPQDLAFRKWRRTLQMRELNVRTPTTVSARNAHCYDNVWSPNSSARMQFDSLEVASFNDMLSIRNGQSRLAFRRDVSDHLPVIVRIFV